MRIKKVIKMLNSHSEKVIKATIVKCQGTLINLCGIKQIARNMYEKCPNFSSLLLLYLNGPFFILL